MAIPIKKLSIILMLGLLTVSAFFIRLENFKNARARSIDEIVYYRMAQQVAVDWRDYNTVAYGEELRANGRPLPEYFFQPLFKHPPLFTFLNAAMLRIFGDSLLSSAYVALTLGVLLIPLTYFLGATLFGTSVGVLSAIFMWMEPLSMICSQKVWMSTSLAFFTLLSIIFFTLGIKRERAGFFILAGIASALGTLTKYSGFLPTVIMFLYLLINQKSVKNKNSWLFSIIIPSLFLIPWGFWNYMVFGPSFLGEGFVKQQAHAVSFIKPGFLFIFVLIPGGILFRKIKRDFFNNKRPRIRNGDSGKSPDIGLLFCVLMVCILAKEIFSAFNLAFLPEVSWSSNGFPADNSPFFYFRQLAKFSPLYIIALVALMYYLRFDEKNFKIVTLSAVTILAFFIAWRNYQSRYILPVIPFLVILLTKTLYDLLEWISGWEKNWLKNLSYAVVILLFCAAVFKMLFVNKIYGTPHDFCYF